MGFFGNKNGIIGATINALDSMKSNTTGSYRSNYTHSGNLYDDLILDSEQEEQLEEAGIDSFEFEMIN